MKNFKITLEMLIIRLYKVHVVMYSKLAKVIAHKVN